MSKMSYVSLSMKLPWDTPAVQGSNSENENVFTGYMKATIGQHLSHIILLFGRFSVSRRKVFMCLDGSCDA